MFQQIMNMIPPRYSYVSIDNILLTVSTDEEHLATLRRVLDLLEQYRVRQSVD